MAYMYYSNLLGIGDYDANGNWIGCGSQEPDKCLTNGTGLFFNVGTHYWSSDEYSPDSSNAWLFAFMQGAQNADIKTTGMYAWAVHEGDVATVPEPGTYAMVLIGLVLVGGAARRRSQIMA